MLVDVGMTLAGPWPLKIVLDNVVGNTGCRGVPGDQGRRRSDLIAGC
jgi:hypothetical protein